MDALKTTDKRQGITMDKTKAARRRGNCKRALGSGRTMSIIADYERTCLYAGLLVAVSFGLMFVYAAVMF